MGGNVFYDSKYNSPKETKGAKQKSYVFCINNNSNNTSFLLKSGNTPCPICFFVIFCKPCLVPKYSFNLDLSTPPSPLHPHLLFIASECVHCDNHHKSGDSILFGIQERMEHTSKAWQGSKGLKVIVLLKQWNLHASESSFLLSCLRGINKLETFSSEWWLDCMPSY